MARRAVDAALGRVMLLLLLLLVVMPVVVAAVCFSCAPPPLALKRDAVVVAAAAAPAAAASATAATLPLGAPLLLPELARGVDATTGEEEGVRRGVMGRKRRLGVLATATLGEDMAWTRPHAVWGSVFVCVVSERGSMRIYGEGLGGAGPSQAAPPKKRPRLVRHANQNACH